MKGRCPDQLQERMIIHGDRLDARSFLPWIRRHAAKLGLALEITDTGPDRMEIDLAGAMELIDMMEMGCWLGPIDVWIETIDRLPIDGKTT